MWTFDMLHFRKPGVILSALLLCHPDRSPRCVILSERSESKDPYSYAFPFGEGAPAGGGRGRPEGSQRALPAQFTHRTRSSRMKLWDGVR